MSLSDSDHTAPPAAEGRPVRILYKNHRNETAMRTILPQRIWFGATAWHTEPQWLLDALDLDKGEARSFALADVKAWERCHEPKRGER